MEIRGVGEGDRAVVAGLLAGSWGTTAVVVHGVRYDAAELPGLLALREGRVAGLLTYTMGVDGLEVVTLDAVERGLGVGSALIDAAAGVAEEAGLERMWLVTTNDNLDALRFYQRRGLCISGVAPGAMAGNRQLKPTIPDIGAYGIPIRDEITLAMRLPRPGPRR